jgi:hypothetical protein
MDATGPLAVFFAATYPDRTAALVLFGTFACGLKDDDYPWAWSAEEWDAHDREIEERWGQLDFVESWAQWMQPSAPLDRETLSLLVTYYRQAASPGMAVALNRLERETDVRGVLRTVQAPTLVMHRRDEGVYRVEEGRYLAHHIPGARFVELEGADHLPRAGDAAQVVHEVGRFLGSVRDEEASFDRVLASVLFTDIVGSTERAAELGDRRGESSSRATMPRCERSLRGTTGSRSTRPGTDSSRRSTGPPGRCGARSRSSRPFVHSSSRSGPASIQARSRRSTGRSAASR